MFFSLFRRELLASQNDNFQLEKRLHELQISLQNPSMANRLSDYGNGPSSSSLGLPPGSSAPPTPNVVRKYYEMKYGEKGSTSNLLATGTNPMTSTLQSSFDAGPSNSNSMAMRNGKPPPTSTVPQPNVQMGARNTTFNLRNKLPNSLQETLASTSQSLQSKLPASLQNLQASLTQGPTINMLASKLQNAFS